MIVIEKGEDYKISASNGCWLIVEFSLHNYNFPVADRDKIYIYGKYRDPSRLDATVTYYRKRVDAIRAAIANGYLRIHAESTKESVD